MNSSDLSPFLAAMTRFAPVFTAHSRSVGVPHCSTDQEVAGSGPAERTVWRQSEAPELLVAEIPGLLFSPVRKPPEVDLCSSPEEAARIVAAAREHDEEWAPFVWLVLVAGMRRAEALDLMPGKR
jgi:hypothetical protein